MRSAGSTRSPGVTGRYQLTRAISLLDVPATVLWWFGVPVPDGYEGRPLAEAFSRASLSRTGARVMRWITHLGGPRVTLAVGLPLITLCTPRRGLTAVPF